MPSRGPGDEAAPRLNPGGTFYVHFPEMPLTFWAMEDSKKDPAQMTITLPKNYTPTGKFPLLVFLRGGNGLNGGQAPIVSAITEDKDFVCASMPLAIDQAGHGVSAARRNKS